MKIDEINAGVLAYLGDSVYEYKVREYLVNKCIGDSNKLQKEALNYVTAANQAKYLDMILKKEILNEQELYTVGRARNYKTNSKPRHTDIKTYKKATALEALFGMLYLNKNYDKIDELMKEIMGD